LFIRLLLLSCDWLIRLLSVSTIESAENWTFYSTGSHFFCSLLIDIRHLVLRCSYIFVSYSYLAPCGSLDTRADVSRSVSRCPLVWCAVCLLTYDLYFASFSFLVNCYF
jgi:hypothetical protein